jgi:hypothetical protein
MGGMGMGGMGGFGGGASSRKRGRSAFSDRGGCGHGHACAAASMARRGTGRHAQQYGLDWIGLDWLQVPGDG